MTSFIWPQKEKKSRDLFAELYIILYYEIEGVFTLEPISEGFILWLVPQIIVLSLLHEPFICILFTVLSDRFGFCKHAHKVLKFAKFFFVAPNMCTKFRRQNLRRIPIGQSRMDGHFN